MDIEQLKEVSGKLWIAFKNRINADKSTDEFWTDAIKVISGIADEYKGTKAEGYAVDMAVFYLCELQQIYRGNFTSGKYSDFKNALYQICKNA